jgi:hypothetical protein
MCEDRGRRAELLDLRKQRLHAPLTLTPMSRSSALTLVLSLFALACQGTPKQDGGGGTETGESSGDGDGNPNEGEDEAEGEGEGSADTGSDPVVNCDPSDEMPCPDGEKCTVLQSGGGLVYDCVPDDTALLPFEDCTPSPMDGQDQCPTNHVCLAPPDSQMGLCLELCNQDNDCDAALCAAPPDLQIQVCAAICDPLAPLCPGAQDCQRVRQSNFVCQYPRAVDTGATADPCYIVEDAGCAEGFVCETGGIIPGCATTSCCTSLCDVTEPNPCEPPTTCGALPLDPQPGLENVGACYVPQ